MPVRTSKPTKGQTRLQFSPLPSSSPAKERYSETIQDRLANVRHDRGGRQQRSRSPGDEESIKGLPTPENSSQQAIVIEDSMVPRA